MQECDDSFDYNRTFHRNIGGEIKVFYHLPNAVANVGIVFKKSIV